MRSVLWGGNAMQCNAMIMMAYDRMTVSDGEGESERIAKSAVSPSVIRHSQYASAAISSHHARRKQPH